jgi:hypothetical protein
LTTLDQSEYVAARLKELQRCQRQAKENLAAAVRLWKERPNDRECRAIVVKSLVNVELANAYVDSIQSTRPLSWFNPTNLQAPSTH